MKSKLYSLILFFSAFAVVGCEKTPTPKPTPEPDELNYQIETKTKSTYVGETLELKVVGSDQKDHTEEFDFYRNSSDGTSTLFATNGSIVFTEDGRYEIQAQKKTDATKKSSKVNISVKYMYAISTNPERVYLGNAKDVEFKIYNNKTAQDGGVYGTDFKIKDSKGNLLESNKISFDAVGDYVFTATDKDGKALNCNTLTVPVIGQVYYQYTQYNQFTSTMCGVCPMMSASLRAAQAEYPDRIVVMSCHGQTGTMPSEIKGPQKPVDIVFSAWNIGGFPQGIVAFDSYFQTVSVPIVTNVKSFESSNLYPVGIIANTKIEDKKITVDMSFASALTTEYYVGVAILEDDILSNQAGGGANYKNSNVCRAIISNPDLIAESVGEVKNGETFSKSYTYTMTGDEGWNLDNCDIIVYVCRKQESLTCRLGFRLSNTFRCDLGKNVSEYRYEDGFAPLK